METSSLPLLLVLASAALLAAGAAAAFVFRRNARATLVAGTSAALLACGTGAVASVWALLSGARVSLVLPWSLPLGSLHVGIDPLSAFFALCIFATGGFAALFGASYVAHLALHRPIAAVVGFFNALIAAMLLVVLARDAFVFLTAWELMFLASFFLVTFEHERAEVRSAGFSYLLASHAGVVALIGLVALLTRQAGSLDFDSFAADPLSGGTASAGFALALFGFGVKAGFWPLHVWLPDAHPAAPSHVSALMSGVMIELGIYGLLRFLDFLGPAPASWGLCLVAIAVVTALGGVLHALAQTHIKRLLAYSSVENVGLVALGIGLGLLGRAHDDALLAGLGLAGGLLHVLNHGLFKGVLFQAAGSVLMATEQPEMDQQGGLLRRMPATGGAFLVGSAAISGLPPLNGFVSELLIFLAALRGASVLPASGAVASLVALAALALAGGLAAACFVKAFGIMFLGEPRSTQAAGARESGLPAKLALLAGGATCLLLGLWPAAALHLVAPVLVAAERAAAISEALPALAGVTRMAAVLAGVLLALAVVRRALLARRSVRTAQTWGCGYSAPTVRMQYTGASFASPALAPFSALLATRLERRAPGGYFPAEAHCSEIVGDAAKRHLFAPLLTRVVGLLALLRFVQRGRLQAYVLYIVLTLLVLVLWQLGGSGS